MGLTSTLHHRQVAALGALLLLLAAALLPVAARQSAAQVVQGGSFGSAVPCLNAEDAFATTCFADTIFRPADAADPALVRVTDRSKDALSSLGRRADYLSAQSPGQSNSLVAGGLGSVYGLAYDDGAISGVRRLFIGAFTKRMSSYGPAGAGGLYEYNLSSGAWSAVAALGAGNPRTRGNDPTDVDVVDDVGKAGLGDLEVSPDGRTLYVMNLASRQIERFDISRGPARQMSAIPIPFASLISGYTPAMDPDLRPFALEFFPVVTDGAQILTVGVTDTAARTSTPPSLLPRIHVLSYNTANGSWAWSLSEDLSRPEIADRFANDSFGAIWEEGGFRPMRIGGWNPWRDTLAEMPSRNSLSAGVGQIVEYPQPWLTDIEFVSPSRGNYQMLLGLRDRTGDQVFAKNAPLGSAQNKSAISQGDTLVYRLAGGSWHLQMDARSDDPGDPPAGEGVAVSASDHFDDNRHRFTGSAPAHLENHQGALATVLKGGPTDFVERVVSSALLGNNASGLSFYNSDLPQRTSVLQLIGAGDPAGGKASNLGDIELLCSYAIIGGRIWQDVNFNGMLDTSEPRFATVTLQAITGRGADATVLASATSDGQGGYLFAVPPNTPFNIRVAPASRSTLAAQGWRITLPGRGGNEDLDSDMDPVWGLIEFAAGLPYQPDTVTRDLQAVPMRETDTRNYNVGLAQIAPTGEIGDRVWNDVNNNPALHGNGLQDSGELGVGGVSVTLTFLSTDAVSPVPVPQAVSTASSGSYSFRNLEPGVYKITFGLPAGYTATRLNAGDDTRDSDVDGTTAYSVALELGRDNPSTPVAEDINRTIDFGVIGGAIDVSVAKTGPAQAPVGGTIDYTITARNLNPNLPALNVVLVDDLPAGATFVSAGGAPVPARSGQRLTWTIGRMNGGESRTFTVRVRAPASLTPAGAVRQSLLNQASITTFSSDTNQSNNRAAWATDVVRPEVGIAKSAPAAVLVGDELAFSLAYANTGGIAAAGVVLADTLAPGLTFTRFVANPNNACSYTPATRLVRCSFTSLAAGASGVVQLAARVDITATGLSVSNTATISTSTAGDSPGNNSSTTSTAIQRPNPGVGITISPSPFPVGTSGTIVATYRNSGSGAARGATLTTTLATGGFSLGTLPAGCAYTAATRTIACALSDLPPGAAGTRTFPIALPASFPADLLGAMATISAATPEQPADQADNTASASVPVVRPNVFVDATGPTTIVGQGSVFWYTIDYGNIVRRNPGLTRGAASVVLRATLPADVSFVSASAAPASPGGPVLSWSLGTLAARQSGRLYIVAQTAVPAGASLRLDVEISTATPGDDPADNRDSVLTDVVQPPSHIPDAQGDLRVAIRSELDPNSRDSDSTNGVYISAGDRIAWPAGEVLDFTPRLSRLDLGDQPPFPYEYRARVLGWSVESIEVNGVARSPAAPDSRGVAGCRQGGPPAGSLRSGCAYAYLGGESIEAIRGPSPLREDQLAGQAHAYWTEPPAPLMRPDVYLYTVDPLAPAKLRVQVEVEVWIVNAFPGEIGGVPLPPIPVVPLPEPERQLLERTFEVTLLVPRSLLGPGSLRP